MLVFLTGVNGHTATTSSGFNEATMSNTMAIVPGRGGGALKTLDQ